jgi:acyl-CoA thioester hydrolase
MGVAVRRKVCLQLTTFNLKRFNLVRAMNEFAMTVVTRWADLDANLHVKNTAYSEWASYVRLEWLASCGFDMRKLMEINFSPVILEDSTKYQRELFAGERIGIDIELVGLKQDGSRWHVRHTFRRNDAVAAVHDVKGAWLDTSRRRIAAPPAELLEASTNLPRASDYAEIVSVTK